MPATTDAADTAEPPLIEIERRLWRARARAKQKRLELVLAEPARNAREKGRRARWIKEALETVKRGQEEVKYETALMDAYAEHLSVLEMTLLQAIEAKTGAPD